jgi:hypothetical protein
LEVTTFAPINLSRNTRYFWRVRAWNAGGKGPWTDVWSFSTLPLAPKVPILIRPVDENTPVSSDQIMVWSSVPGASQYAFEIRKLVWDDWNINPSIDSGMVSDTSKQESSLEEGRTYGWRVASVGVGGQSDWSSVKHFRVIGLPDSVALVYPRLDDTVTGDSLVVVWQTANPEVDKYLVEVSGDSNFSTSMTDSAALGIRLVVTVPDGAEKIWVRIKAHNAIGWGPFDKSRGVFVNKTVFVRAAGNSHFQLSRSNGILRYSLPQASHVDIRLFDTKGCWISWGVSEMQAAGSHHLLLPDKVRNKHGAVIRFKAGEFCKYERL